MAGVKIEKVESKSFTESRIEVFSVTHLQRRSSENTRLSLPKIFHQWSIFQHTPPPPPPPQMYAYGKTANVEVLSLITKGQNWFRMVTFYLDF